MQQRFKIDRHDVSTIKVNKIKLLWVVMTIKEGKHVIVEKHLDMEHLNKW